MSNNCYPYDMVPLRGNSRGYLCGGYLFIKHRDRRDGKVDVQCREHGSRSLRCYCRGIADAQFISMSGQHSHEPPDLDLIMGCKGRVKTSLNTSADASASFNVSTDEFAEASSSSSMPKRFKEDATIEDEIGEIQLMPEDFGAGAIVQNQMMLEEEDYAAANINEPYSNSNDEYVVDQEYYDEEEQEQASKFDDVTVAAAACSDDVLATVLRNQQLMLDSMHRLESKFDGLQQTQFDFNLRLTTLENQSGSLLSYANGTHEVVRQIQKLLTAMQSRVEGGSGPPGPAVRNSGPPPATVPATNNASIIGTEFPAATPGKTTSNGASSNILPVVSEQVSATFLAAPSTATGELQQALNRYSELSASLSSQTPSTSTGPDATTASRIVQYRRPAAVVKLKLDPQNSAVGWIGGNQKYPISTTDYGRLWTGSGGTPAQFLFSLLLHVYGGPGNLKQFSMDGGDGRPGLKNEPAFEACIAQLKLQCPGFQLNAYIAAQLTERLSQIRKRRASPSNLDVSGAVSTNKFAADALPGFSTVIRQGSEDGLAVNETLDVTVKDEVIEIWNNN